MFIDALLHSVLVEDSFGCPSSKWSVLTIRSSVLGVSLRLSVAHTAEFSRSDEGFGWSEGCDRSSVFDLSEAMLRDVAAHKVTLQCATHFTGASIGDMNVLKI